MPSATSNRTEAVEIACTARLHLGFLDLNGGLGRRFGSIGMALDRPRTRLLVRRADHTVVDGPDHARVGRYLSEAIRQLRIEGHHALRIAQAIPPHGGLGSGTQLALAVGAGLRLLHGLPADPRRDAALLGRGKRSGIGLALFQHGGLVVDGGVADSGAAAPPLLARLAVPEDWRVLLVQDRAREGLSGDTEIAAFARLPPMTEAVSGEICRLVLMQALPAVACDDLAGFGAAIGRVQALVGDHFAPAQGGRFASPRVAAALAALRAAGATGIGQSSWGPTGFAFVRGADAARGLADHLAASPVADGLDITICRGLNQPAAVSVA